jgi:PKD repeat protein
MNCTYTDASTDPNGAETIANWSWVFDDGASAAGQTASHVYATPGDHSVGLTVTDNGGLSGTVSETHTVTEGGG